MLKTSKEQNKDLQLYLLNYRNAPVANLEYSPAQLMMNRTLRSKLPTKTDKLIIKNVNRKVVHKMLERQRKQKIYYDKHARKL